MEYISLDWPPLPGLDHRLSLCLELVLYTAHQDQGRTWAGPDKLDQSGLRTERN